MLSPTKRNQRSLEKDLLPGLGQEKYKNQSEVSHISKKQGILKEWGDRVKRTQSLLERDITGQTKKMLNTKDNNDGNVL